MGTQISAGHPPVKFFIGPRRKACTVALGCLALLVVIAGLGHVWYRNRLLVEVRADVLAGLDPYGNALAIDLRRRFDLIHSLAAWLATKASMAEIEEKFEPFARQLGENIADVRALAIAPDGVVRLVFPRAGNEAAIGRNISADPREEVRTDTAQAIQSRKVVISSPHEMAIGGFAAVARLAVFREEKFWGLLTVAVDLPPVLAAVGLTKQKSLRLALRDRRGRVFFGLESVIAADPVIHRVDLPDDYWELAAIPAMGWNAAVRRDLRIFDVAALTTALLLSAIAYLLVFRSARLALRVKEGTHDLTVELERREIVENELRAAEARYQTLVEVNPDAVLVIANTAIVYANKAALRLFGAPSLKDLLGRSPFDLIHPEDRAEAVRRHQLALSSGAPNEAIVQRRLRLDGSLIYVETVSAPLAWESGIAVQVILRDLTEQRKAERSLHGLIETTQDAVISIDRQANIVMFNAAAERIFGYQKAEIVGKKVNLLMAEPYASEHDGYIEHFERTGEARAIGRTRMVSARRKNGQTFPIELSVTQIASGEAANYAAFIRDISEKVKLQQQAVENERLATIGTMATKFGHELGNPLNGMSLTVQLLEQRLKKQPEMLDEQVGATLARLKSEIARLNTLLLDFRSLSRKETYKFHPTSLSALVSEALEIELPGYVEQGVVVESRFPRDLPSITVDVDKMKQLILNLAKNAVDAMPKGGKLSFVGSAQNGVILLEVSDTGAGIPLEVDIFEPFFTTKPFGTGIGMTIVRQIVAAHGGTITYRSLPGKGTTFTITLPLGQ
jgi:two-component system sensor kinase FixL